jgi:hypothetical protein
MKGQNRKFRASRRSLLYNILFSGLVAPCPQPQTRFIEDRPQRDPSPVNTYQQASIIPHEL